MNSRLTLCLIALLCLCSSLAPALASWPDDPGDNLSIADRTGDQTVPKLAADSAGGCYVAWFDHASGNYDVYLQRLNAAGEELWPHNGVLVSDHLQDSWLCDWDLAVDGGDNAIVVFTDLRDGGDWDVHVYKLSPAGLQLWGEDGLTLTDTDHAEYSPMVAVAADGDVVVVWTELPNAGDGKVRMQRISPSGEPRLAAGGVAIAGEAGESPAFCDLIPAGADEVIVTWQRDLGYMGPRHVWAERFDAAAGSVWGAPVVVYDLNPLPMGYAHEIMADGVDGAVILWHAYEGGLYQSRVQHLDADGAPLLAANGLPVSTYAGMHHISPTATVGPGGDIYVFWDERNSNQSQWGLFGQKIPADGTRAWGERGMEFLPTDTLYKSHFRALPAPTGALVFWIDEPAGAAGDRIRSFRVDGDGIYVWDPTPVDVSTAPGGKWRLPAVATPDGNALLVWEDDRGGDSDLFGMRVNLDGSLGGDPTAVPESPASAALALHSCFPNPFNPVTTIRFSTPEAGRVDLAVYDMTGRRVKTLVDRRLEAGPHELIWDGTDDRGRPVASGVYFSRVEASGRVMSRRMVLLK